MDPLDPRRTALLMDTQALAMAAACWEHALDRPASFEVRVRRLPAGRAYLVACGLDTIAQYLLELRFEEDQVRWLRSLYAFHTVRPEFWEYLLGFRFHGDLWGAPEGTPVFPDQTLVRIRAPFPEARILESYLLTTLSLQSAAATRMARLVQAARGKPVIDAAGPALPGPGAVALAARAAYIAGAAGSFTLEAGHRLGVPVFSGMDHTFVLAFPGEQDAFCAYQAVFPESATLALDTYDALRAGRLAAGLDLRLRAVRLGQGDLAAPVRELRRLLDEARLPDVRIQVAGELDEHRIEELMAGGAPVDSFAVRSTGGLGDGHEGLALDYELVEVELEGVPVPRLRTPLGRPTLPGATQTYRRFGIDGLARGDTIGLAGEKQPGAAVLAPVIQGGKLVEGRLGLESIRAYTGRALASLPTGVRALREPKSYPVTLSDKLRELRDRLAAEAVRP